MTYRAFPPKGASLPHTYWNYMVIWYPSIQAYTLTSNTYTETGDHDDQADLVTRHLELGPFDTYVDALNALRGWINDDSPWQRD